MNSKNSVQKNRKLLKLLKKIENKKTVAEKRFLALFPKQDSIQKIVFSRTWFIVFLPLHFVVVD
jgi:hypothetical protein